MFDLLYFVDVAAQVGVVHMEFGFLKALLIQLLVLHCIHCLVEEKLCPGRSYLSPILMSGYGRPLPMETHLPRSLSSRPIVWR